MTGYGYKKGQCVDCGVKWQVNMLTLQCECASGYYMIRDECGVCAAGSSYHYQTESCVIACPKHSTFNILKGKCECAGGYYL